LLAFLRFYKDIKKAGNTPFLLYYILIIFYEKIYKKFL